MSYSAKIKIKNSRLLIHVIAHLATPEQWLCSGGDSCSDKRWSPFAIICNRLLFNIETSTLTYHKLLLLFFNKIYAIQILMSFLMIKWSDNVHTCPITFWGEKASNVEERFDELCLRRNQSLFRIFLSPFFSWHCHTYLLS